LGKLIGTLYAGGLTAQLFCDPQKHVALARIYQTGAEYLGLSRDQMDGVLEKVQNRVQESLELFNLDVGAPDSFEQIQQQTRLELARLGMEAQSELQQTVSRQRDLEGNNVRLQEQTLTDHLTGLASRAALDQRLLRDLHERGSDPPLSLLMIDIDQFKHVNDTFGHRAGDQVLAAVGKLIARHTREHDLAARYGGDEFVAVLPGATLEQAVLVAERMRKAIQKTPLVNAFPERVTVSIGAACTIEFEEGETTPQDLIDLADRRMYEAKESGRNCIMH
jgi:diguanylate cyclase (GGDEF)-like protein